MAFAAFVPTFYMLDTKQRLFLFGYVFDESIFKFFGIAMLYLGFIIDFSCNKKDKMTKKKIIVLTVILSVMFVCSAAMTVENIHSTVKMQIAADRIELSDGKEILLVENEKKVGTETMNGEIYVYRVNGSFVKKLGEIREYYFSNKCVKQNKYTYKYDESTAKLVITCEYGIFGNDTVSLKEEYDTGFLDYEFNIK